MKKQILLMCVAITGLALPGVSAQNSPILEAYIQAGLNANLHLQQQNLDVQKSVEAVRQAKGLSLPSVQFNASYTRASGGRRIDFPLGDLLNPLYETAGLPLRLENQTIQFLPDNFHETKLKVAYPLFNSDLRYNRQIQEHLSQTKTAEKAAYEHELRYLITDAYLQYLKALEAEKIWQNAKTVLEELRRFNQALVKNNVATRDVVATAEYEISKADNEIFKLQSGQNSARAYFNFLINRDLQMDVQVDSNLIKTAVPAYEPQTLIQQALNKRQEFTALRSGMAAAETALKLNEANRRLPDAYIGGEVGFQGFGYTFKKEQAFATAQVGLTYDIFTGGQSRSKIQQAKIESEKVRSRYTETQQQIALQVTQAWNEFEAARNTWITSQQGLKSAEETFRIVNNKYRASQALLLEFLDAENRVTTARLQVLLAWSDVLLKEAGLKKAAGI